METSKKTGVSFTVMVIVIFLVVGYIGSMYLIKLRTQDKESIKIALIHLNSEATIVNSSGIFINPTLRNPDTTIEEIVSDIKKKELELIFVQGLYNDMEKEDSHCKKTGEANKSVLHDYVKQKVKTMLPPKYEVIVSDLIGDRRNLIIYDKTEVSFVKEGIISTNDYEFCEKEHTEDRFDIVNELHYGVFKTEKTNFTILNSNVNKENNVSKELELQNYIFRQSMNSKRFFGTENMFMLRGVDLDKEDAMIINITDLIKEDRDKIYNNQLEGSNIYLLEDQEEMSNYFKEGIKLENSLSTENGMLVVNMYVGKE